MPINLLLELLIPYLSYLCCNTFCFYNQYPNIHLSLFKKLNLHFTLCQIILVCFYCSTWSSTFHYPYPKVPFVSWVKMLYLWYSAWSRGLGDELEEGRELGRTDPRDEALSLLSSWPEVEDDVKEVATAPAEAPSCPL